MSQTESNQPGGDAVYDIVPKPNQNKSSENDGNPILINESTNLLQRTINDNANPSPVYVSLAVACVLISMWLIYILFLKPNASGEWRDDKGNQWILDHGRFGGIMITVNKKNTYHCEIVDNMFKCGGVIGIWNYRDIILFVGGGNLTRVH
jgi:hypothetical protein